MRLKSDTYYMIDAETFDDKMHQVKIRAQEASALLATCNTYEECKDLMTRYGYIKEV